MKREILACIDTLNNAGSIIYPTDTIWGIGCDATDSIAVEKVYKIKNRSESKSLIILVHDLEMLKSYVSSVPDVIEAFLKSNKRPTTVVYDHPNGLASNVIASDDTVAIRIVGSDFCKTLIKNFGKPIVSTSANLSDMPAPNSFSEINPLLLKEADYVVNLPAAETKNSASQIIKVNDLGEIEFLRK